MESPATEKLVPFNNWRLSLLNLAEIFCEPAFICAKLVYQDIWNKKGVYNIEQFDPDVFMEELNIQGLPWKIKVLD